MTNEEVGAPLGPRVATLERTFGEFRRDVADQFKEMRADSSGQTRAILDKIESQNKEFGAAQARTLEKGQFNLGKTLGSFVAAGSFLLAVVGAGVSALQVPTNASLARNGSDIAELKGALTAAQDRADKRIEQLAGTQVTRAEHEVHWRAQDRDYDFMRDRIGRVEGRIEKRLERLEGRFFRADK